MSIQRSALVAVFLAAIAAANLIVAAVGPAATPFVAFFLIGLDLIARDTLHDAWHQRHLWPKMALLVTAGALISYLLNRDAAQIAVASCVAFAAAGVIDTIAYRVLHRRARLVRMNGSNIPAALADSLIFPTLAFGVFMPWIVVGQFAAKVLGGFVWSLLFTRRPVIEAVDA